MAHHDNQGREYNKPRPFSSPNLANSNDSIPDDNPALDKSITPSNQYQHEFLRPEYAICEQPERYKDLPYDLETVIAAWP